MLVSKTSIRSALAASLLAVTAVTAQAGTAQAAGTHNPKEIRCGWSPGVYTSCERRHDWYESVWGYVPGNNVHNLRKKAAAVYGDAVNVTPGYAQNIDNAIVVAVRAGRWQCINNVIDNSAWTMQGKIAPVIQSMQTGTNAAKKITKNSPSLKPYAAVVASASKITKGSVGGLGMLTVARAAGPAMMACDPYA